MNREPNLGNRAFEAASPVLLDEAFDLLLVVIEDSIRRGRRPLAATLKQRMFDQTHGGFLEERLGFSTFGRFLQAAEARGIVTLRRTPLNEIVVMPAGAVESSAQDQPEGRFERSSRAERAASPVPSDLWRAFVDWTPGLKRVYHRPSRRAVMFPVAQIPLEKPEDTDARSAWKAHPEEYVEIVPISMEKHLEWMHAFAQSVTEPAAQAALQGALASGRALGAFSIAVRAPHLWRDWRAFRLDRVVEVIERWGADYQIEDPLRVPEPAARLSTSPSADAVATDSQNDRVLRLKVLRAVERMPISDLKRLSIPVEFLDL